MCGFFRFDFGRRCGCGSGRGRCGCTDEDCAEFTVHCFAHDLGEEQAGRTDDTADCDEEQVVDCKTCDCACDTTEGVEQRNGDRHIRTTDTDCEDITEEGREYRGECDHDRDDDSLFGATGSSDTVGCDDCENNNTCNREQETANSHCLVTFVDNGFLRKDLVEFARCNEGADEGNHTDCECKRCGGGGETVETGSDTRHCECADDCGRRTAETVEECDHLRHLDHLDFLCKDDTCHGAESESYINRPNGCDGVALIAVDDDEDDGNEHADCTDSVTDFGVFDVAHHCDADENAARECDCECEIRPLCVCAKDGGQATDDCDHTRRDDESRRINQLLMRCFLLRYHREHSIGDHETADDVDHCKRDCEHTENCGDDDTCRTAKE